MGLEQILLWGAMLGGPPLISALLEWANPVSAKEKELLGLQQKGAREQFDRENLATRALQQEDANAKWKQMMMQMGMGQAQQNYEGNVQNIEMRGQSELAKNAAQLPYLMGSEGSQLAANMQQPASVSKVLGL